jgi:hypothetical protein
VTRRWRSASAIVVYPSVTFVYPDGGRRCSRPASTAPAPIRRRSSPRPSPPRRRSRASARPRPAAS